MKILLIAVLAISALASYFLTYYAYYVALTHAYLRPDVNGPSTFHWRGLVPMGIAALCCVGLGFPAWSFGLVPLWMLARGHAQISASQHFVGVLTAARDRAAAEGQDTGEFDPILSLSRSQLKAELAVRRQDAGIMSL